MIERYGPHSIIVDGEVRHPDDVELDDADDDTDFEELALADQEAVIEILDHMPHRDASLTATGPYEPLQQPREGSQAQRSWQAERHLPPTAYELGRAFSAKKLAHEAINKARALSNDQERPYDELGGRAPQDSHEVIDSPLETITIGAKEWMRDVHDMLRYAIPELTPEAVEAMNRDDKKLLALHFQGLWDRIPTAERLISWGEGDVTTHPFLEGRYGKRRSPEEMKDYMLRLTVLDGYLEANRAAWLLRQIAYDGFRSKKERDSKYVQDRRKHGDIQVVLGKDGKYHTERLATGTA